MICVSVYTYVNIYVIYQEERPRYEIRWLRMIMNKVLHFKFVFRQIPNQIKLCMVISARNAIINLVCPKERSIKTVFPFFLFL